MRDEMMKTPFDIDLSVAMSDSMHACCNRLCCTLKSIMYYVDWSLLH